MPGRALGWETLMQPGALVSTGLPSSSSPGRQINGVSVGLWERSFQSPKLCPGGPLSSKLSDAQDEPVPLPPSSTAMRGLAGHFVLPHRTLQLRPDRGFLRTTVFQATALALPPCQPWKV